MDGHSISVGVRFEHTLVLELLVYFSCYKLGFLSLSFHGLRFHRLSRKRSSQTSIYPWPKSRTLTSLHWSRRWPYGYSLVPLSTSMGQGRSWRQYWFWAQYLPALRDWHTTHLRFTCCAFSLGFWALHSSHARPGLRPSLTRIAWEPQMLWLEDGVCVRSLRCLSPADAFIRLGNMGLVLYHRLGLTC